MPTQAHKESNLSSIWLFLSEFLTPYISNPILDHLYNSLRGQFISTLSNWIYFFPLVLDILVVVDSSQ